MNEQSRGPGSLALVLSIVALFISLGGGAYATFGPGSVGTKDLRNRAVSTSKLKSQAVTTSKIGVGAVTGSKIADGSIGAAKLREGVLGRAVAYAEVQPNGLVVESRSRGIDDRDVATISPGLFCFGDLPDFGSAVVTPIIRTPGERQPIVAISLNPAEQGICGAFGDADLAVVTQALGGSTPGYSLEPFEVVLFR